MLTTIRIAEKSDKKCILRFYRRQHYRASFIGYDQTFLVEYQGNIIAAVIISCLTKSQNINTDDFFLHALVVDAQYQRKALGTTLLSHVNTIFSQLYCFADINLQAFYCRKLFEKIPSAALPEQLAIRYWRYQKTNRALCCYKNSTINQT